MPMQKITADSPDSKSADLVAGNLAHLKTLFPDAWKEGKLDFDVLRQLLGGAVDDREEKYGLNWHGKKKARQIALTPSTGTLRPCPADSVDWDTTQNLMIEGDNLEVLKLLQKSYAGKVKMIYIDPPYNTGTDFVYADNFQDNIKNYLELTGQASGGMKTVSNTESSGRFHTDWLNMMLPRIKLARNLLRDDGVIFTSIDDGELENLRLLYSELFGEENFVVQIIWKKRSTPPNDKVIGANHDYILCYAKNIASLQLNLKARTADQLERYQNPDNHPKGKWAAGDLMANIKGGRYVQSLYFPIKNPKTGEEHFPSNNGNWRFSADTINKLLEDNEISFGEDGLGRPKLKRFLCDVKDGVSYASIWDFVPLNTEGSGEMEALFGNSTMFESPKPTGLLNELIRLGTAKDSIVLDFFAGSGSTGHAIMQQNASDEGTRKFILVQLPEVPSRDSEAAKAKYSTISDVTKERLRRCSKVIKQSNPLFSGDLGFRVYKLDSSNIREWEPKRDDLAASLEEHAEHLKAGRTEADILTEVLLKLGLDLCVPIEQKTLAGKAVHSIGAGALFACLAESITAAEVEPLAQGIVAWHAELKPAVDTRVVFRDSAFADDVAKTNLAAILEQHGLKDVRSL